MNSIAVEVLFGENVDCFHEQNVQKNLHFPILKHFLNFLF